MPTYVMLTNLTPRGVKTLKNNPTRVQEVNKEVEQLGVKVKSPVGDPGPVRLRHRRRGARRRDDGQGLGRARLARDDEQPDAGRVRPRSSPGALEEAPRPLEGPRRRRRRARARDRARAGALAAPRRSCSARPATPGSRPTPPASRSAPRTWPAWSRRRARGRRSRRRRARGAAGRGPRRRARGRRDRRLRAERGAAAARGLEGLRQGGDGRGGVPTASHAVLRAARRRSSSSRRLLSRPC